MSAKVRVGEIESNAWPEWSRLVAESPAGSIYATPEYLDAICRAGGGNFRLLGVRRGDELVGGLPLYERTSASGLWVGPRLLLYYLGPVLKRPDLKYPSQQTARDVEALGALADAVDSHHYAKVILKGRHSLCDVRPFIARGWHAWPSYSYVVSLTDLPAQWARVEQNLRRLVDRCIGEGLTVTEDDSFDEFLRLHAAAMRQHQMEPYLPNREFRQWFTVLRSQDACRLFQARLPSGQPVAAQVVLLGKHSVSHTVSAGSDPDYRNLGASAFLRWRVFERLARLGATANDLTDAALNPVTHFKSQFGGDLVVNLVVETAGTFRWRAGRTLDLAISSPRRFGGALLRRFRPPGVVP